MNHLHIGPSTKSQDWHHKNCYGCGPDNIRGLHFDFPFDEEKGEVVFVTQIEKFYEGAPGFVHGGILAAILDEAQGVLCFHAGHFVMTEELKIKYKKATPLQESIEFRAFITAVRKRRLYTKATVKLVRTGELLAYSTAKWYDLPERIFQKMFHRSPLAIDRLSMIIEENKKRGKQIRKRLKENP
jgi:acyl-coenzyme A thioesterase PaaI-like protein